MSTEETLDDIEKRIDTMSPTPGKRDTPDDERSTIADDFAFRLLKNEFPPEVAQVVSKHLASKSVSHDGKTTFKLTTGEETEDIEQVVSDFTVHNARLRRIPNRSNATYMAMAQAGAEKTSREKRATECANYHDPYQRMIRGGE